MVVYPNRERIMGKHSAPMSISAANGGQLRVGDRVLTTVNSIARGKPETHVGSVSKIEWSDFWEGVGARVQWDDPIFNEWDRGEVYLSGELNRA